MEKEYRSILSKLIKNKRRTKKFSITKASKLCDVSISTFSRIENGRDNVNDDIYFHVGNIFDIPIRCDLYEILFNELYYNVIQACDNEGIKEKWKKIENIKSEVITSPYMYKYNLYELLYFQYLYRDNSHISLSNLNYLLKNENEFTDFDKCVLYDVVSTYFYYNDDVKSMRFYSQKSLKFSAYEIPYGVALDHTIEDLTYNGKYIEAIDNARKAIDIFERNGFIDRRTGCLMDIGNIYSIMGDNETALSIFGDTYSCNNVELKAKSFNNILLSNVLIGNKDKVRSLLSNINNGFIDFLGLNFYATVLRFFVSIKEYDNFDIWYKKSKYCKNRGVLFSTIIEFYNSYRQGYNNPELGEQAIDLMLFPYNNNEYIYVAKLLINIYENIKEFDKAEKLKSSLIYVSTNKTTLSIYNS